MRSPYTTLLTGTAAILLMALTPGHGNPVTLREGSRVWFDGTSTVRSWNCTADKIDAVMQAEAPVSDSILANRKVAGTVQVDFPIAKLECRNNTMNEHMRKALDATRNPAIRFELSGYELVKSTGIGATLQGTLQMNGQTRPITVPVQFAAADGALRVTGSYPLKMTDWGVRPPRLMMGAMKVGESVTVHFDLLLQH